MRARKFGASSRSPPLTARGPVRPGQLFGGKAGDIGFTKALALENAKGGITVNAICPGYINTEMVAGGAEGTSWRRA